jgi:hypothetical protein
LLFFGEAAVDKNRQTAFVNGLLISLAPSMDVSVVHRQISRSYQSVYSNAFTENTKPTNEKGFFTGISLRPGAFVHIDAYADLFSFPWLKFRVDAPSKGKEYFVQFSFIPNKQVEISTRYRSESKDGNTPANTTTSVVEYIIRRNWRIQSEMKVNALLTFRNRCELNWYQVEGQRPEQGFLTYMDFLIKPPLKPWSANIRLMYFETQGYNSRLYAFENDVLNNFSVPSFFDKGYRYYINLHIDLTSALKVLTGKIANTECWFRCAQTLYSEKNVVGSGTEEISGNKKTDFKFQCLFSF